MLTLYAFTSAYLFNGDAPLAPSTSKLSSASPPPSVSAAPSTGTRAADVARSTTPALAPKFAPLVAVLRALPPTPAWTEVGGRLCKLDPLPYATGTFKAYVAEAERAGVVETGVSEKEGQHWMRLKPAFQSAGMAAPPVPAVQAQPTSRTAAATVSPSQDAAPPPLDVPAKFNPLIRALRLSSYAAPLWTAVGLAINKSGSAPYPEGGFKAYVREAEQCGIIETGSVEGKPTTHWMRLTLAVRDFQLPASSYHDLPFHVGRRPPRGVVGLDCPRSDGAVTRRAPLAATRSTSVPTHLPSGPYTPSFASPRPASSRDPPASDHAGHRERVASLTRVEALLARFPDTNIAVAVMGCSLGRGQQKLYAWAAEGPGAVPGATAPSNLFEYVALAQRAGVVAVEGLRLECLPLGAASLSHAVSVPFLARHHIYVYLPAMPPALDHIIVLISHATLHALPKELTAAFTVTPGGTHADGLTENKLIIFADGSYIELIAFLPSVSPSARAAHWWGRKADGLIDFAITSPCLPTSFPTAYDAPQAGGRTRPDGVGVEWVVTFPSPARFERGAVPFWCHDTTPRALRVPDDPPRTAHPARVRGVAGLTVRVPRVAADDARKVYGELAGVEPHSSGDEAVFAFSAVAAAAETVNVRLVKGDDEQVSFDELVVRTEGGSPAAGTALELPLGTGSLRIRFE
ncbi:hypothetical protein JCM3770_003030 [Rhodotorula araucariae]